MKHRLLAVTTAAALVVSLLPACSSSTATTDVAEACVVEGCVARPGPVPLDGERTLLEAVLAAGPIDGRSDLGHVQLVRAAQPRLELTVDVAAMLASGDSTSNVLLRPGDVLHVPELP
jgi:protein involved in polysaccharide export with SLBB domain